MSKKKLFIYCASDLEALRASAFYPGDDRFRRYRRTPSGTFTMSEGAGLKSFLYQRRLRAARRVRKIFGLPRNGFFLRHALQGLAATHRLMPFCATTAAAAADARCEFIFPGVFLPEDFWLHFGASVNEQLEAWWRSFPWQQDWTENWLREGVLRQCRLLRDHELAITIGNGIAASGVSEIAYISRAVRQPTSEACATDVAVAVWERMFPGLMRPLAECPRNSVPVPDEEAVSEHEEAQLNRAILFCLVSYEVERTLPLIRETARSSKRKVAVCYYGSPGELNSYKGIREAIRAAGALPVYVHPALFQEEAQKWVPKTGRLAASAAAHMMYADAHAAHWEYLEQWLWPQYEGLLAWWEAFMRRRTPACCITSEALLPESSIPRMAAQRHNIPAVGIPHAYAYGGMPALGEVPVEHFACTTPYQESMLRAANSLKKTYSFGQICLTNEYRVSNESLGDVKKKRVVFFHIPTQAPHYLHFNSEPRRHIKFLAETMRAVPPALRKNMEILHKVHPGNPDRGALRLSGITKEEILPVQVSTGNVLEKSDAAISYNYTGAPFLHGMKYNISNIIYWDPLQAAYSSCLATHYRAAVEKYGLLTATNPQELWELVARLLQDNEYYAEVLSRQRLFYEERLRPERNDWDEWLEEIMCAWRQRPHAKFLSVPETMRRLR